MLEKIWDKIEEHKPAIVVGCTALAVSLLRYIHFIISNRNSYITYKIVSRPKISYQPIQIQRGKLSKEDLLRVIAEIKRESMGDIKSLRNKSKKARRAVFQDTLSYIKVIDEYNAKILHSLEDISNKIFAKFKINNEIFDDTVREYISEDDVSHEIHTMANVEDIGKVPKDMTRDKLLEIFHYNNKRLTEGYPELKNVSEQGPIQQIQQSYEYLTTRVQDDIFLKYGIDQEDMTACYKKWGNEILSAFTLIECNKDRDFEESVSEMKHSSFRLASPTQNMSPRHFRLSNS